MANTYLQLNKTWPFQDMTRFKEKYLCPFLEFFFGNLRSVGVFLRIQVVSWEVIMQNNKYVLNLAYEEI